MKQSARIVNPEYSKKAPYIVQCMRGDSVVMTLRVPSRSDADALASYWSSGMNMSGIAEVMRARGIKA